MQVSWMTRTTPGFEGLAIDEQGHKDGSAIEDKDTRRARRYAMQDVLFLMLLQTNLRCNYLNDT